MVPRESSTVRWEWIPEAWRVFSGGALTWILMQGVVVLFLILAVSPIVFLLGGLGVLASRDAWAAIAGLSVIAIVMIPLLLAILIGGGAFFVSGFYRTAIRKARGEEIGITDLFSGGDSFLSVLGYLVALTFVLSAVGGILGQIGQAATGLNTLASFAGTILNLLIFGLTICALPLIVDRRLGVGEAIRESLSITLPHWPMYLLLAFVIEALSGAGFILCFVGILLTSHFQWTIPAAAYCDIFGLVRRKEDDPFPTPPPPPDYRYPDYHYQDYQSRAESIQVSGQPSGQASGQPSGIDQSGADLAVDPQTIAEESPTLPLACSVCGSSLNRQSRFCSQCGHPYSVPEEPSTPR